MRGNLEKPEGGSGTQRAKQMLCPAGPLCGTRGVRTDHGQPWSGTRRWAGAALPPPGRGHLLRRPRGSRPRGVPARGTHEPRRSSQHGNYIAELLTHCSSRLKAGGQPGSELTRANAAVPPPPRERPGPAAELRLGSAPSPPGCSRRRPALRPRRRPARPALRPGRGRGGAGSPARTARTHTGIHTRTPGHTETHSRGTGTQTRTRTQAHESAPRAANMALVPCQVLHAAILLSYCSILCNYKAIDMPAHQTYGGSWKFLTFIDLVIQAVFFGICVLTDLSSLLTRGNDSQEQERQLKKLISLRDWMMAVLAFPVGVFVVTMFWSIYIYDRELVYPKLLDNFIPAWLNHGMHTTVLPFVLIEMRTTHHQYPSRSCGLAAVCTFSVGYILWVCWIHHVTGVWVYPLLEHLSPGVKIIFFAAVTVVINVFYLVGEVLNNYIWDTQKCIEEGKEKPKVE